MKIIPIFLWLLMILPCLVFSQEVIISGEALYNTNYSLINGSIMNATITSNTKKKSVEKRNFAEKLDFVRSETLSKSIQKDFISRISQSKSYENKELEKMFSENKLRNEFDRLLAEYGYSGKNLADAMTAYLVISWQLVNAQEYNDRKGFDAVRKMVRENLLASEYLNSATDKDKQIVSETFAYQAMLTINLYKTLTAKRNQAGLEELKISVAEALKKSGMDMKTLNLTTKGFVKK